MSIFEEFRKRGYAPGDYCNKCNKCGQMFVGDKRARTCFSCAVEEIGNVADRPNACAQLADVLALRDVICEMEKHMPDESSALGELYKDLVCKYNKVGEHFS